MAIKIPRGEIPAPSVGNRGSSILNAVQSNKINFDKLTNTIDAIGTRIQAHNTKIEDQRIDNKNTKNKSLLQADINLLLENIKNNEELSTDGKLESYNTTYDTEVKKLKNKYSKIYKGDDAAFAMWESNMYTIFNNGQINMWKNRRKKVLADAQINFESGTAEFNTNLDSQPVTDNIWESTNLLIKQEKERFTKALNLGIKVNWAAHLQTIEDTVWKKVISSDKNYVDDMTGLVQVDYQTIYNELSASKSTNKYFGKTMSKEKKETLLEWAKSKATEQNTMKTNNDARIDNENSVKINKLLSDFRVNKLDIGIGESGADYIKNIIHNTKLTDATQDAHYKELESIISNKNKGTSTASLTHGDPVALNEHFDQIILGNSTDNVFIQRVNQDDRLTAKGKEMLIGWADDYNKNRNEYKDELVTKFMQQFDTKDSGYPPQIIGYLRAAKPQIWNELMRTLSEGEKAGISFHAMLGDTNSDHYIGWKFLEIYQTSMLQNLKDESFGEFLSGEKSSPEDFFGTKRDEIYKAFFDADNSTDAHGNQLQFIETPPKTDKDGNVIEQGSKVIDKDYAIFTQRLLNKPLPPERVVKDKTGKKETIEELTSSHKWKKYKEEYKKWVYEGEFNSDRIPTINKYFNVTDMPTTKIKN